MSSNFYPSQTSGIPGLEGALNSQYPDAEQMPLPSYESALAPSQPQQAPQAGQFAQGMGGIADVIGNVSQTLPVAIENLRGTQQQMVQAREPEPPPIGSITRKADGTTDLKGVSSKFLEDVMGQMNDLKTMKSAAMARVAQLRQQEASGSPILDALSQFAGGMAANDPTMPGWVRALGQTNLQMGNQGIAAKRKEEEAKAFAYGKEITDTAMEAAKFNQVVEQSAQTNYLKAAEITRKMLDDQKTDNKEFSKLMGRVSTETRSMRDFDPDTFAQEAKALGVSDEQIAAAQDKFLSLASMAQQKYDLEQRAKDKARREDERQKDERQAISIGAAMERVLKSKDVSAIGAAQKLDMQEESFLSSARSYDEYLKQSEAIIEKYKDVMGPVSGRLTKWNPWRRKEAQEAMAVISTNLQRYMQGQGESVARGSDKDMKLFERSAADITLTPEQALQQLKQQRETLRQKYQGVVEVNPYADWNGRYSVVVPDWAQSIVGETLARVAKGQGMALPSGKRAGGAKPPDLPKDFTEFLGKLPPGKWAKAPDGKKYTMQGGVAVEVP